MNDDDGDGGDALGRLRRDLRREHGAMYARMRSMLDEDAREARTRKRLRRALVEEFPEFDAYAIDVAVAWDDARCATLARGLVETPTAEVPFGERSPMTRAAEKGLKERLKFLHEHACAWDAKTCSRAANNGHLECLKYAHEHGCAWDEETCEYAAGSGHLECLKYAHEHGCSWSSGECGYAADNGHLECLKYAHEHGCAWDERTLELSLVRNHWKCVWYAIDHQCPGYKNHARRMGHLDFQCAETIFVVGLALSHARNGYIPEREYYDLRAAFDHMREGIAVERLRTLYRGTDLVIHRLRVA